MLRPSIVVGLSAAWVSTGRGQTLDQKVANAWTFAASQVQATAANSSLYLSGGDVQYPTSTNSTYTTWTLAYSTNQTDGWYSGFFPGELWYLYSHTGNSTFQTEAETFTNPLQYSLEGSDAYKGIVLDQDAGFQTECSWGNALQFSTNSAYNGAAAVSAYVNNASYLNTRFVSDTGMMRSLGVPGNYSTIVWPFYSSNSFMTANHINNATVIDHMMELPCLFESYVLDPNSTTHGYYLNAITDAVNSANELVRANGSSYNAVWHYDDSDPDVSQRGQIFCKGTVDGFGNETTWSRGQAWGMYGFTQAYEYTRNDPTETANSALFLSTAQNMANYFVNNLPANLPHTAANYVAGDYVPPTDFNAETGEPAGPYNDANDNGIFDETNSGTINGLPYVNDRFLGTGTYTARDTSAAAVAAAALFQLCEYGSPSVRQQYFTDGTDILNSLLTESSTSGTGETDYFGENTSGQALSIGLLLKFNGTWSTSPSPADSVAGDYYLLQAMSEYQQVEGQFLTWTNAGGDNLWDTASSSNWNDGSSTTIFNPQANVTFNDSNPSNSAANYSVTLNTTVSPGSVTVNNSLGNYTISGSGTIAGIGSLTKSGTGTLTLSTANTYTGGTIVTAGRLLIEPTSSTTSALPTGALSISGSGIVQLANNVTAGTALGTSNVVLTSLSLTGNGTLDIGNNRIIIDYSSPATDPITSIEGWIKNGYLGTPGPQIISSDIAADDAASRLSYGIGYADGADGVVAGLPSGEIEIMFTLLGDANLDGTVNSEDFSGFSHNMGQSGMMWDDGDFNYDGTVNSEDFSLFSHNLGQTASLAAAAGVLEAANGINLTNVPEPASAGMMVMAGLGILRRRRRDARRSFHHSATPRKRGG
jgi:unsaturated chondroitin disaccharide hydrolase